MEAANASSGAVLGMEEYLSAPRRRWSAVFSEILSRFGEGGVLSSLEQLGRVGPTHDRLLARMALSAPPGRCSDRWAALAYRVLRRPAEPDVLTMAAAALRDHGVPRGATARLTSLSTLSTGELAEASVQALGRAPSKGARIALERIARSDAPASLRAWALQVLADGDQRQRADRKRALERGLRDPSRHVRGAALLGLAEVATIEEATALLETAHGERDVPREVLADCDAAVRSRVAVKQRRRRRAAKSD